MFKATKIYREVTEKIKAIDTWDGTIKRIDRLNRQILRMLRLRSQYPRVDKYVEATLQKEVERKGIDTVGYRGFYNQIEKLICSEYEGNIPGEVLEKAIRAESMLERLLCERTRIAVNVIRHKAPRGMPIERKKREDGIYDFVRKYAENHDMNPDAVEGVFRLIIEKNKHIQRLHGGSQGTGFREVKSCRTMYEPLVEGLKKRFKVDGELLALRTGCQYHVVTEKKNDQTLPVYVVKLLEE